jgi:putative transcriptional regulator
LSRKTNALTDFDNQLIAGMEEVVAHITGKANNGRATVIEFADAKAIREKLGMSQAAFSRAYGIPVKTLQHWEQRRHNPDRTASAYLWTIEEFPDQVREAQQRHQMQQPAKGAGKNKVVNFVFTEAPTLL